MILLFVGMVLAGDVPVPGSRWLLRGEGWPVEEAVALGELAALPGAPWAELPLEFWVVADTGDPDHSLAHLHGRRMELVVGADPLHSRSARIHALAHAVDRSEGWSRRRAFRSISGWGRSFLEQGAVERDPLAWARPLGSRSPAEDFATMAELFWTPSAEAGDLHPRCRMPSKWRFWAEIAGVDPAADHPCASLEAVGLDPEQVVAVDLVYIVATGAAASLAGHMAVALHFAEEEGAPPRAEAWSMVAEVGDTAEGSLAYAYKGVTGGFPSVIQVLPLEGLVLDYTEEQDREVRFYRLNLGPAEKAALLRRLDELRLAWDRPYLFFNHNCVRLPFEVAEAAWPGALPQVKPMPPDVLLAALARQGRIAELPLGRVQLAAVGSRAIAAATLVQQASLGPELRALRRDFDAKKEEDRGEAYRRFGEVARGMPEEERVRALQVLHWQGVVEAARGRRQSVKAAQAGLRLGLVGARNGGWPTAEESGDAELLALLERDRSAASSSTPFRPVTVFVELHREGSEVWWGPGVETALYDARIGPGRRFSLSDNVAVSVLKLRLLVDPTLEHSLSSGELLHLALRPAGSGWLHGGLDLHLLEGGWERGRPEGLRGDVARAELSLGPPPGVELLRDARVGIGLAAGVGPVGGHLEPMLRVPLSLELALGSGVQQRTAVSLRVALWPGYKPAGGLWLGGAGEGGGRDGAGPVLGGLLVGGGDGRAVPGGGGSTDNVVRWDSDGAILRGGASIRGAVSSLTIPDYAPKVVITRARGRG